MFRLGKWFTLEFIGNRHDPYSDIGLVSAQGNSPITVSYTHLDVYKRQIQFIKENYGAFAFSCKQYDSLYELMLHDKKNTCLLYTSRCV